MQLPEDPRLFVALTCPEAWNARAVRAHASALGDGSGPWRPYAPEDLHLTLCFLGERQREGVPALVRALEEELRGCLAPELVVEGAGAFPDPLAPRVLFLGVRDESPGGGRLEALHDRVRTACLAQGWREPLAERRRGFRPHVTLARSRGGRPGPPETLEALRRVAFSRPWLPVEVTLLHSTPAAGPPHHHPLAGVPLVVRPG